MNLPKDAWYVRLFHACLYLWATFSNMECYDRPAFIREHEHRTNLCFFVRTIVVWAPLTIAVNLLAYGAAIGAVIGLPIYYWGLGGVAIRFGAIALGLGIVAVLVALARRYAGQEVPVPSAVYVASEWVRARKESICPTITFEATNEARS